MYGTVEIKDWERSKGICLEHSRTSEIVSWLGMGHCHSQERGRYTNIKFLILSSPPDLENLEKYLHIEGKAGIQHLNAREPRPQAPLQ